jgi:hypothetical protein
MATSSAKTNWAGRELRVAMKRETDLAICQLGSMMPKQATRSRHGFNQVSRAETKQILHIRNNFHMDTIVLATNRGGTDIVYTA